jgi:uncharacterized repeat protein (TIGR02543 family)
MLTSPKLKALMPNLLLLVAFSLMIVFPANAGVITYTYDELDRLTEAHYSTSYWVEYKYDQIGNITNKIAHGTVTVTVSPSTNSGSVTQTVNSNGVIVFTAVPATGYNFVNWTGTDGFVTSTTNPLPASNVTTTQKVTANFVQTFQLNVSKKGTGSGSVTPSTGSITWSGTTGTATYNYGTSVTLTATPNPGKIFTGWSGACTGRGTCTVTMNSAQSVSATFVPDITPILMFLLND